MKLLLLISTFFYVEYYYDNTYHNDYTYIWIGDNRRISIVHETYADSYIIKEESSFGQHVTYTCLNDKFEEVKIQFGVDWSVGQNYFKVDENGKSTIYYVKYILYGQRGRTDGEADIRRGEGYR